MTMLETKNEIIVALANNNPLSFDAMMNALLAVQTYIDVYGDHDIRMEVTVE